MVVELVVLETDLGGVFEVAEVALPGLLRLVPGGDVVLNVHEGVPAVLAHCPTRLLVQLEKKVIQTWCEIMPSIKEKLQAYKKIEF